jgi:serine/threonine protein kinase
MPSRIAIDRSSMPLAATPRVPDHELIRPIGAGAAGEVWLARSTVGTLRAVKIVSRNQFAETEPYDREFRGVKHFEPLSRSHEGLVDLLQVGRNDEERYFYYVMELADDTAEARIGSRVHRDAEFSSAALERYTARTLRSEINARGRLPVSECIEIGLLLADALRHLHENGLVHRDIKPSNIIFVNSVPKLADVGLVIETDEAKSFVGTLGYIPPEGPGKSQGDLYSLGKVLYEMSTGKGRHDFPQLPADLRDSATPDALIEFNEILLKACESETRARYQNAQEMSADLAWLQQGNSIQARRSRTRRLAFGQRAAMVLLGLAVLLIAGSYFSKRLAPRANTPKLSASADANTFYYWGRHFYEKKTETSMVTAIAWLEKAVAKDPKFASAHGALASAYCWSLGELHPDYLKARNHAEQALALDRELSEPHKALACVKWLQDWDFSSAEREFRRAIELAPSDASAHEFYGFYLGAMTRGSESIKEFQEAERLDPLSLSIPGLLADAYFANHQDELGLIELQKVNTMEPNTPSFGYRGLASFYEDRGDFRAAIDADERWRLLNGEDAQKVVRRSRALREAIQNGGPRGYWRKQLEFTEAADDLYTRATLYARLGEKDEAFKLLEQTRALHDSSIVVKLKGDPALDSLRSEPRYAKLLKELKWN